VAENKRARDESRDSDDSEEKRKAPEPSHPAESKSPNIVATRTTPGTEQSVRIPVDSLEIVTRQEDGKTRQYVRFKKAPAKHLSTRRKLLLAAVPGFLGVMGISQFYQERRIAGALFLLSGAIVSFLSSWYLIILARVDALVTHGTILSAYSLSFLSSAGLDPTFADKLSADLLGVVALLWAFQLFDAVSPIFKGERAAAPIGPHEKH